MLLFLIRRPDLVLLLLLLLLLLPTSCSVCCSNYRKMLCAACSWMSVFMSSCNIIKVFAAWCYAKARPMTPCGVRPFVCLSVRLSVTFVDSVKMNKHIFIFYQRYPYQFSFSIPNAMVIFRRGPPNGGVECRWGRQKSRFSTNIWLSDRWSLKCEQQCDGRPCSLPHKPPRISESSFITTSMDDHDEEKTTEQHVICAQQ